MWQFPAVFLNAEPKSYIAVPVMPLTKHQRLLKDAWEALEDPHVLSWSWGYASAAEQWGWWISIPRTPSLPPVHSFQEDILYVLFPWHLCIRTVWFCKPAMFFLIFLLISKWKKAFGQGKRQGRSANTFSCLLYSLCSHLSWANRLLEDSYQSLPVS